MLRANTLSVVRTVSLTLLYLNKLYKVYAYCVASTASHRMTYTYLWWLIHSGYSASSSPLQHLYSEALPTQHGYCVGVSRRSATGNCERRTCPRFLRGD